MIENLINKIHNCKNQNILPLLPDKSVQVFLEDMPYGITACKWDTMPNLQEYWELRLSKIKDNGCFVLFGSEPFSSYLRMSNIKMYKYDWIWLKNNFNGLIKKQPSRIFENILIFYKNNNIYNEIKIKRTENEYKLALRIKPSKYSKSNVYGINKQTIMYRKSQEEYWYKKPVNVLEFKCFDKRNIQGHPTQKPVALFEYLIKTYSNENDLIFDGFSGSGTTAIACYNTNRNFICCETEKDYYDKSIDRLNEAKNNLFDGIS